MRVLIVLLLAIAPAWSAPAPISSGSVNSGSVAALPTGSKATLHFARPKVAVGAISDDAHQSEFWIEVRDSKGQPQSGVTVDLPLITKGGQGKNPADEAPDNSIRARLEWLPSTLRVKHTISPLSNQAITGADGRARGRFTSGYRAQRVELAVAGGATASIMQVWNEVEKPFEDADFSEGEPTQVRFTMRFHDGQKWIPITGHHLSLEPKNVRLSLNDPKLGPDEDEDGQPDGISDVATFSEEKPGENGWKAWLKWSTFGAMTEVSPGVYLGAYLAKVPEGSVIDGKVVEYVDNVGYNVWDNDGYGDEPQEFIKKK